MAQVTTSKTDARVTTTMQSNALIVDITSQSGIGDATVHLAPSQQPQRVTLRFHLKGLEELRFGYGSTTVIVSISSSAGHRVSQRVEQTGTTAKEEQIAERSPYWMPTRLVPAAGVQATIPLQSGVIEVEAPPDFFASQATSFSLRWIDFYR
jgi:hypothetical protein